MATSSDFIDGLQTATERFLTKRRMTKRIKREKQKAKNPIVDWIEAFVWAAGVVLLVNQYLFQAYQIPSGSMIDTLLIGDRIFVNKLVYGPELLPGIAKLPSPFQPKRNQIVIFENPSYLSKGPAFDVAQRVIYMLTLSIVDIDKDENGEPRPHFLIKRAVGMEGDVLTMERGEMSFRFPGETSDTKERDYLAAAGAVHPVNRLMAESDYPVVEAAGRAAAYDDLALAAPAELSAASAGISSVRYPDYLSYDRSRLEVLRAASPQDGRYAALLARYRLGWYVPEGRIFPMGDNRDNSRDARYFGAVKKSKVLGEAMVKYWPFARIGPVR
ncbi:MAG TPA: signal peptidase I [Treponema sp.]|nr:MAG: signal peptidase I [Treponema sp. GWC1_61_84]HCM27840.1 signal peptidase I [Treponema sp.]